MNSLTSAFNNTANHFTTSQASQLIQIVSSEANRLQLAKLSYKSITDQGNFNQIYSLLSTQASKNELAAYINSNYNNDNNPSGAMTDANFNSLYNTIQQQWPVGTQMNSLTSAFNNTANHFTTNQASQLIQIVSAEANRLQLAKLSYRSITDPANFNQIYNLLSTQASKNELTAYLNTNYNTGIEAKVAMTEANFNTLYQTIQAQYLPFEQMKSLTSVFNNTSYYFTSAQAKQLIPLVSLESNRLQLAKLSYRTIVDRGNFSQLYELLNSQAGKNELDAYVKAYKE
jgi:DNA polymerase IIIc chi subunit